jgi:hypothetical protein
MFTSEVLFTLIVPGIFMGFVMLVGASFIPDIFKQYQLPAKLMGIVLILFFTFQSGRYNEVSKSKLATAELKAEIAALKGKRAEVTTEVVYKYIDRIKVITETKEVPVYVYVTSEADAKCVIDTFTSNNIRMLLNDSNKGLISRAPTSVDGKAKSP